MKGLGQAAGYKGGYRIGFIMIGVVALRAMIFYRDQPGLTAVVLLIAGYTLLYSLEPRLSERLQGFRDLYFPVQTAVVFMLSRVSPFLDFNTVLYFPLWIQAFRAFPRPAAVGWVLLFIVLLGAAILPGLGWPEGSALLLLNIASGSFLLSYDSLYARARAEEAQSQRLLADLQSAHRRLQDHAARGEELAAARERNRLARELHDSVSQVVFSITLTSQAARLLLERDTARATAEIARLQEMTSHALNQLRSLIAELRPQSK